MTENATTSAAELVGQYRHAMSLPVAQAFHLLNKPGGPADIPFAPLGFHASHTPHGSTRPVDLRIDSSWAPLFARDAQQASLRGDPLRLDFDHSGGQPAGIVRHIFFASSFGLRALVAWTVAGEVAVLTGASPHFSPQWLHADDGPIGLVRTCGALLSKDRRPAFSQLRYSVRPTTALQAMYRRAELLLELADDVRNQAAKTGEAIGLTEAFDQVGEQFPDLLAAFQLRDYLRNQRAADRHLMQS